MTQQEAAEAMARCEAATEGPWCDGEEDYIVAEMEGDPLSVSVFDEEVFGAIQVEANRELCREARTDLPAALADREALIEALVGLIKSSEHNWALIAPGGSYVWECSACGKRRPYPDPDPPTGDCNGVDNRSKAAALLREMGVEL